MTEQEAVQKIYTYCHQPALSLRTRKQNMLFVLDIIQDFLVSQNFDDLAQEIQKQRET